MFGHVGTRSRWVASAAVVAMILGAGGVLTSSAASEGGSAYVPITPCRLLDTRPGSDTVGARSTPLSDNETYTTSVWGSNGNCTIPSDAVAVVMNLSVVNPSADSFLVVFPAGVARPLAANLTWRAGDPPSSNAVTSQLSAGGMIALFNLRGRVDVIVDLVGYYSAHVHDGRYYTKAEVDTKIAAKSAPYVAGPGIAINGNVIESTAGASWINVRGDGTAAENGARLRAAVTAFHSNSAALHLGPGEFDLGSQDLLIPGGMSLIGVPGHTTIVTRGDPPRAVLRLYGTAIDLIINAEVIVENTTVLFQRVTMQFLSVYAPFVSPGLQSAVTLTDSLVYGDAQGGPPAVSVHGDGTVLEINDSQIMTGLFSRGAATVIVDGSRVAGLPALATEPGSTAEIKVVSSMIDGPTSGDGITCLYAYDANFAPLNGACL